MRQILVFLLVASFSVWANLAYAQDLKLGYVSLKDVLDNYNKVKDGEEELLKEAEEKNDQREALVKDIKNLREKIELLKDKQKESKQKELDGKLQELQDFTYQTRTDLREKRDEKFREIMQETRDVIEEYGSSRKYNIIIDDTLLLYKDEGLDVTEDIIKILNQRYKK